MKTIREKREDFSKTTLQTIRSEVERIIADTIRSHRATHGPLQALRYMHPSDAPIDKHVNKAVMSLYSSDLTGIDLLKKLFKTLETTNKKVECDIPLTCILSLRIKRITETMFPAFVWPNYVAGINLTGQLNELINIKKAYPNKPLPVHMQKWANGIHSQSLNKKYEATINDNIGRWLHNYIYTDAAPAKRSLARTTLAMLITTPGKINYRKLHKKAADLQSKTLTLRDRATHQARLPARRLGTIVRALCQNNDPHYNENENCFYLVRQRTGFLARHAPWDAEVLVKGAPVRRSDSSEVEMAKRFDAKALVTTKKPSTSKPFCEIAITKAGKHSTNPHRITTSTTTSIDRLIASLPVAPSNEPLVVGVQVDIKKPKIKPAATKALLQVS